MEMSAFTYAGYRKSDEIELSDDETTGTGTGVWVGYYYKGGKKDGAEKIELEV